MNKNNLIEEQKKLDLIRKWLSETTEPFDDWDYNGKDLIILFEEKILEKYTKKELTLFIKGFK